MRKFGAKFLLFCIVILGFFIRIWNVTEIPPSLSWDEVSIGYNAYSILKTGRDEHGRLFPLDAFSSYGDYKPPLSIYLTVPFVAIFGLNELAVRLLSVLFGTLAILLTFFVINELFRKKDLAILSSVLLALSPWHVNLSRAAFEANIALAFVLWGSYLVLRTRVKRPLLLWCFLPFVLAMYTFNSARYSAPLIALGILVFCKKVVKRNVQKLFLGLLISFIALTPLIPHLFSAKARLRFIEVNIFSDSGIVETSVDRMKADGNAWWAKFAHNRRIGYARSYLSHFFDNVEPWFLFMRGDGNPKFSIQDVGQLYIVELPFFVFGILALFRSNPSIAWLFLWWIVASIIPAATARETPHALRIENSLPIWQVFIAYGILLIAKKKISRIIVSFLFLASFAFYWHTYYNHYAKEYSGEWQYGYREAILYARSVKYQYDAVVIDDIIGRPYMYALFYEAFDPRKFQDNPDRSVDGAGFFHVNGFDQYRFIDRAPAYKKKTLYVTRPGFVPSHANVQETIRLLNGSPILVIFDIVKDPNEKT